MSNPGNMLRLARQLRGFQQREAADRLRLGPADLSRMENGVKDTPADVIESAAKLFSLPMSFFDQKDAIYGTPVSVHPAQWRKKSDVPAGDLHRVIAELNVRTMHLRKLLEATELEPARDLPRCDADQFDNDAEHVAGLVRGQWQIPLGPIQDFTALVEEAGVVVAHSDFGGSSISGVTFRVAGLPPLIVLNQAHPADRMRFTLAHELGHLVMHKFPTPGMEDEADLFASCLLAPTEDARSYFEGRKVDLRLLAAMKKEWQMSMGSLIFVADRCGVINRAQKDWLWKQMSMNGYRRREPPELDLQNEAPKTLNDLIVLHTQDLGYGIGDLARTMHVFEDEFARIHSIEVPDHKTQKHLHLRIVR